MIPLIGLIIAIYAVARLVQTPIESLHDCDYRWAPLTCVSVPAIALILVCLLWLLSKS